MSADQKIKFGDKLKQRLHIGSTAPQNTRDPIADIKGTTRKAPENLTSSAQGVPKESVGFGQPQTFQTGSSDQGVPKESVGFGQPQMFQTGSSEQKVFGASLPQASVSPPATLQGLSGNQQQHTTEFPDTQKGIEQPERNVNENMSQIGHSNPSLVPGSGVSHANKNTPIQELSAPTAGGSGIAENKPAATDIGINTQKLTGSAGSEAPGSAADNSIKSEGIHASDQPPAQQGTQTALGSAKELGTAALQNAQTTLQQVKQSIEGAVPTGASAGSVGQAGKDRLVQASSAVAKKLDEQGINSASSKQKMEDIGQALKDYTTLGQEQTAEYLQQAVDTAHAIGRDERNQSILVKVLGAVVLVWLAFGFSLSALLTLGIIIATAAILSHYSGRLSHPQHGNAVNKQELSPSQGSRPALQGAVDTHFPMHQQGIHPDSSINSLEAEKGSYRH